MSDYFLRNELSTMYKDNFLYMLAKILERNFFRGASKDIEEKARTAVR